jgi:hypothetical protein
MIAKQTAAAFKNPTERLQGVLIYEDFKTGTRAKDVCDHLLYQIEIDTEIDLALWRFDMLLDAELSANAANQAASADIVVLSAHGNTDLPPAVKRWLRQWLELKRRDGHSALIVSLDQSEEKQPGEARILASLRTMVESAGVDLIPHYSELRHDTDRSEDLVWDRVERKPLFVEGMTQRPSAYEHWGLNE